MHVRWSSCQFNHYIFLLVFHLTTIGANGRDLYHSDVPRKWRVICVKIIKQDDFSGIPTGRLDDQLIVIEEAEVTNTFECLNYEVDETTASPLPISSLRYGHAEQDDEEPANSNLRGVLNLCIEDTTNGTKVVAKCPELQTRAAGHQPHTSPLPSATPDEMVVLNYSSLGTVVFWGAQTYMTTNIAHVVLCIVVVVVYLSVPELGHGLYNRAVLRHNVCLMMHGGVLTLLGYCDRDHCDINNELNIFLWLSMQFFTNATIFWLNVICFDMTLAITRFRWMPATAGQQRSDPDEDRRLFLYGIFAWGTAVVPAIVAAVCEYVPGIPKTFVLKPNYTDYHTGRSVIVSMYFFALPLFTLLLNNILFLYTTYKIIKIQRDIETATSNQTSILRKKYFLFLRLYLLMGAPWFFGALLACLNDLVVLKMFRLTQPILWLLMLATHKNLKKKLLQKISFMKTEGKKSTVNV